MDSVYDTYASHMWIAPFGYPRIDSCLQIPGAFRSLPRPSSAPNAKASSLRSYQLKRFFAELCLVSKNFFLGEVLKLYFTLFSKFYLLKLDILTFPLCCFVIQFSKIFFIP